MDQEIYETYRSTELLGLHEDPGFREVSEDSALWKKMLLSISDEIYARLTDPSVDRELALRVFYNISSFPQRSWDFWFRAYTEFLVLAEEQFLFDDFILVANEDWRYLGVENWARLIATMQNVPLLWSALATSGNFTANLLLLLFAPVSLVSALAAEGFDAPGAAWLSLPERRDFSEMVRIRGSGQNARTKVQDVRSLSELDNLIVSQTNQKKLFPLSLLDRIGALTGSVAVKGVVLTTYLLSLFLILKDTHSRAKPSLPSDVLFMIRNDDAPSLEDFLQSESEDEYLMLSEALRFGSARVLAVLDDFFGFSINYVEPSEEKRLEKEALRIYKQIETEEYVDDYSF